MLPVTRRLRILALALVSLASAADAFAAPAAKEVTLVAGGRARVYLEAPAADMPNPSLSRAIEDLEGCFRRMAGVPLPRDRGPLLLDPSAPAGVRAECSLARLEDASGNSIENGTAMLTLTPTTFFEGNPLAGPGEKVAWCCAWQRAARKLEFRLVIANAPWYGPGYGPFTCAQLAADAPGAGKVERVRLAIEARAGADGGRVRRAPSDGGASDAPGARPTRAPSDGGASDAPGVRGGYSLEGGAWVYTPWLDPARAGTDTSEPGKSDRNGPQAWSAAWPKRWAGRTALFATTYGAKDRAVKAWMDRVTAVQGERTLFESDLRARPAGGRGLDDFSHTPQQGSVTPDAEGARFEPSGESWNTVGVRADRRNDVRGLIPLRLRLEGSMGSVGSMGSMGSPGPSHCPYFPHSPTRGLAPAEAIQGFRVDVGRREIVLRARTRLGLQNAIYWLLDGWGCRWVLPGALGEVIPARGALRLPLGTLRGPRSGDVSVEAGSRGPELDDWYQRNLAGWERWLSGQHYWPYAIPPERHFKEHPEWFALIGGQRVPAQICTTNPDVIARMIDVARQFLREHPYAASFPMDPQDNIDFCQCARCRAQDPPGRGRDGNPFMADRVIRFANAVAAAIEGEFPDRVVACYAYWTHTEPPVRVKPARNVAIIVTRGNYCMLHLKPTPTCPASLAFHELLRKWGRLTPNLYVYEYDPISWTGSLPCPTYLERAAETRLLFRDYGVKGIVSDRTPRAERSPTCYINNYFERRIKADPTRDPDAMLTDMCRGFFGPAARAMVAYYRELARAVECRHAGRWAVGVSTYRYYELFNRGMVSAARRLLDQAAAAAKGHAPYAERVRFVETGQRYLEAYLDGIRSAQAGRYERAVAAFERVDRLIDEMARTGSIDPGDARARMTTARMKALAEHCPDRLGMVRSWELLGPFDNDARDADVRTDSFQPVASVDKPVSLTDGSLVRWRAYESPTGLLNLEEALKGTRHPWVLSYAYAGVKLSVPRRVSVQLRMDSFFPFRVFLNGKEVYHRPGLDADCPDKRIVSVALPAGESALVFKLSQTALTTDTFPWGLYLRITNGLGEPIRFRRAGPGSLALDPGDAETDLVSFPEEWRFHTDPDNRGEREGWQKAEYEDGGWQSIRVPLAWEDAIGPYDGAAWYRVRFFLPDEARGKQLLLGFEGVDEEAWVYLNGELIGERTAASTGRTVGEIWDKPFATPVRSARFGAENVLAVRVHDSALAGGITGAVRLFGRR